jgi:hypothetical protein
MATGWGAVGQGAWGAPTPGANPAYEAEEKTIAQLLDWSKWCSERQHASGIPAPSSAPPAQDGDGIVFERDRENPRVSGERVHSSSGPAAHRPKDVRAPQ